jgi:hypothetical protein
MLKGQKTRERATVRLPWHCARMIAALVFACTALAPVTAAAQSGLAGTVTDSSGGVLPGVTVEAASPALIEKVRTAVSDDRGRYNIIDLRPGRYTITFTLPGFTIVKQELDLPAAFTATVNAQMPIGTLQETVTVAGGTPTVDVRNTAKQTTLNKEMLDAVPSGGTAQYYATLMLGVSQEAQSFRAPPNSFRWSDLTFRGARESSVQVDGFDTSHRLSGDGTQMVLNSGMTQEVVISRGAGGADQQAGGLVTNVIPKTGGDRFSGSFNMHFANEAFVGDNVTEEMVAAGIGSNDLRKTWDLNPAFGGPLLRSKLWFFASYRNFGNKIASGAYRDLDPLDWVYTPDTTRPTDSEQMRNQNYSGRLTWQATPRNTISVFADVNPLQWDNRGGIITGSRINVAPEATLSGKYGPQFLAGVIWKSPASNRLYLEGGMVIVRNKQWFDRNANDADTGQPVSPDLAAISAEDLDSGWIFRGSQFIGNFNNTKGLRLRGAASYLAGGHTFTLGWLHTFGYDQADRFRVGDYTVRLRTGVPAQLVVWGPEGRRSRMSSEGIHLTDQWVFGRATMNLGLRYDYQKTWADPYTLPASSMLPERSFPGADKINYFHDLSPRVGLSYDLFGNNRTALKFVFNRYVSNLESAQNRAPSALAVTNTTRDWTDTNRNFIPDCDLRNFQLNDECGRLANLNFGLPNTNITQFDPEVDGGFFNRGFNWEFSTGIQHQITQGLGLQAGYYRRWWGNQTVTDNLVVTPADYSPFCVVTPLDSRLPGGGGEQICGYHDLRASLVGQVRNFVTNVSNFGEQRRIYQGVEIGLTARIAGGLQLDGGFIAERIQTNDCFVVDNPTLNFCNVVPPFQTTVKFMGSYPLPFGFQISGAYQGIPGPAFNGTRTFSRSEILGLNQPLSTSTVTLTIVEPNQTFGPYTHKLDMRLSKILRIGERRITGSLDAMNVTNSAGVLSVNTVVGPNWLRPTAVQAARAFRIAARYDF